MIAPLVEHCEHECVCAVLAIDGTEGDTTPCDFSGCLHDTRATHTSPPAPMIDSLDDERLPFSISDEDLIDFNVWMKEHDRKAREKAIGIAIKKVVWIDGHGVDNGGPLVSLVDVQNMLFSLGLGSCE